MEKQFMSNIRSLGAAKLKPLAGCARFKREQDEFAHTPSGQENRHTSHLASAVGGLIYPSPLKLEHVNQGALLLEVQPLYLVDLWKLLGMLAT